MSAWTLAWLVWGAAFAVIETIAIRNDTDGDTLSEHLRRWFRTDTRPGRTVWLVASGGFLAWFLVHVALEGVA